MDEACAFCEIAAGRQPASFVLHEAQALAFLDLRQFHPGHVLVVPRTHIPDIRAADVATAQAVMAAVVRVARAVAAVFPCDGLSVWHSAGEGANQEVPHLHFHVHPRHIGDDLLRVYPAAPAHPPRNVLLGWASELQRAIINQDAVGGGTSEPAAGGPA